MWYQLVILKVTLFLTAGLSFLICECHFFPLLTVFGKSESDFSVLVNVWQRDGVTEILLPAGVLCAYVALSGICCSIWVLLCRTVTVLCVWVSAVPVSSVLLASCVRGSDKSSIVVNGVVCLNGQSCQLINGAVGFGTGQNEERHSTLKLLFQMACLKREQEGI